MPVVRLLHGLGADRRAFQRFERLLPESWDIASIDLLGHGDAPHPKHGYSLEHHAAWIEQQVQDSAPVVLVGHSYGAATSVAVAARSPQLATAIVLLDPVVREPGQGLGAKAERIIAGRRAGSLPAVIAAEYPDASPALQAWTVETWTRMSLGVVDELDLDWTRLADRVTCPVSIIHGELELGGAGDLSADWFHDPLVTCIEGAGHYLHATHAREVADAVSGHVSAMLPVPARDVVE